MQGGWREAKEGWLVGFCIGTEIFYIYIYIYVYIYIYIYILKGFCKGERWRNVGGLLQGY